MTNEEHKRLIFIHNGFFFSNKLNRLLTEEKLRYESIDLICMIKTIDKYQKDLLLIPDRLSEIVAIDVSHSLQSNIQNVIVLTKNIGCKKLQSDKLVIVILSI